MASIFTYDPDPPRVSSPWSRPEDADGQGNTQSSTPKSAKSAHISDYGVTKLQAEPQDGPTEYKLHLLLRKRRAYTSMSTAGQSKGYHRSTRHDGQASTPTSEASPRQQRLRHLTTQLLWRLQQSSPYHASSSKELVVPRLPADASSADEPVKLGALVQGLEESRGALYEIGVADDGSLIGLTKDEMDESVATLRTMAASLGCSVEVVRMVVVGHCEWEEVIDLVDVAGSARKQTNSGKLWVAEAFVLPNLGLRLPDQARSKVQGQGNGMDHSGSATPQSGITVPSHGSSKTLQLRVTLTGPTTSGKSSLLGTLSTGTLDNGRGKSRLSLLKHRHEVVTGVTSSIAQEIIGYKDHAIMNFAQVNIESWTDIHDRSEGGRLVFVSDSGGHPRYRRTVLRGLMNWAPHWSILCLAADEVDSLTVAHDRNSDSSGTAGDIEPGPDLVSAHLRLSLKLDVPLAIVITKLDLASKAGLQKIVGKVLTAIKESKRTPKIIQPDQKQHDQLQQIPDEDCAKVRSVVEAVKAEQQLTDIVPIILTSAVKGTGIGILHALLEALPVPAKPTSHDFVGLALNPEQPTCLFHIDDKFSLDASYANLAKDSGNYSEHGIVVSGYLRFGDMSVGDRIVIGPFPAEDEEARASAPLDRPSPGGCGLSVSNPSSSELTRLAMRNAVSASAIAGEWHHALIVSVRNLRLPVRTLAAGQAGSIGLVFEEPRSGEGMASTIALRRPRVRRGMVAAIPSKHMRDTGLNLQAASGFTAAFSDRAAESLTVGAFVNVYVASVRATAKIVTISRQSDDDHGIEGSDDDTEGVFHLHEEMDREQQSASEEHSGREIFLELLHNREWIEMGSKVIISEGASQDRSGLEGIVGRVTEIVD